MKRLLLLFALALCGAGAVHAVTLDWDSVNWTDPNNGNATFSQSFNVDASNAGNDVTITISGSTSDFEQSTSPDDTTDYNGGFGSGQESLVLRVDYNNNSDSTTVTIDFSYASGGVTAVSFAIFDVDFNDGQFRDILRNFVAYDANNNVLAVYATLTNDATTTQSTTGNTTNNPYNAITGSGTANAQALAYDSDPGASGSSGNVGQNDDEGNVYVSFVSNGTRIDHVSFVYDNDGFLGAQAIALGDITWTTVPEPSTVLGGGLLVALAGAQLLRRLFRKPRLQAVAA
jgi:hypothetical protein